MFRIYYINYSITNVIVLLQAQDGAVVDFFIVYVVPLSPLTTVKSQATNVPVQVVNQHQLLSWLLFVGIACFTAYTWASVAIAVPVLVAAVVLEGTTGLVQKVLVQHTVCAQLSLTTALSLALFHNAVFKSVWFDKVQVIPPQATQVINQELLFKQLILSQGW